MSFSWFISVDDHLIEPARLWQERVPERWREHAPHIVRDGDSEFWALRGPPDRDHRAQRGRREAARGVLAGAHHLRRHAPRLLRAGRAGRRHGPRLRVVVAALPLVPALLRPGLPRGEGQGARAPVRAAWNDFILEEFAGAFPGRFIPTMIIPLWDPTAAVAEIERTAALGAKSIAFSENPTKLGLPSIHTDYWDPVFRAVGRDRVSSCRCTWARRRT